MTKSKSTYYISQWVAFIPPAKAGGFSAPTKIKIEIDDERVLMDHRWHR